MWLPMKTNEIRQAFLTYFAEHQHEIVSSSPLVPENDPTLLFTNAGMNQFKEVFLGEQVRHYQRAVTSQRVVRAGGKHNDLENVGYTARHHTFFEMLGNFSFGDYFKSEAIRLAWRFLTEVLNLPKERLWITVFNDDEEAADIWVNDIGIDPNRLSRLDETDNFWQMGDTGPCGPCSEIFYDHGPGVPGGPPGSEQGDLDRYVEIWNLVFMQYNRFSDGRLEPLPKPSVDTGMGLERLAAVLQGVTSNYDIDIFKHLIQKTAQALQVEDLSNKSLRVIADHIRSSVFLIVDGVIPSNEGRGYVLRRIIRRALRHGHNLGAEQPFFYTLADVVVEQMASTSAALTEKHSFVKKILLQEEEQFAKTLDNGLKLLLEALDAQEGDCLEGGVAFKLYDTYGFPLDLTADVARERGFRVDQAGFDKAMASQRAVARQSSQFGKDYNAKITVSGATDFQGYQYLNSSSVIESLYFAGESCEELQHNQKGTVVLKSTPFYAESGGQVGDTGVITTLNGVFKVEDCTKQGDVNLHQGSVLSGVIRVHDSVEAKVDDDRRRQITLHHSATHLMHAALRRVLGSHVQQKGSLVMPDRLRFDFAHLDPMTAQEIEAVESLVNNQIGCNSKIQTEILPIEDAKARGAMALFGEKYDEQVRVLSMGEEDFSIELCGGTHAERTGDLGYFKILSETGIAAGVRRVEAVVGHSAFKTIQARDALLMRLGELLKAAPEALIDKTEQLINKSRQLERGLEQTRVQLALGVSKSLALTAKNYGAIKVLAAELPQADVKVLRITMDQLKQQLGSAIILLAATEGDKVSLLAGVTKDLTRSYKAGDIVRLAAEPVEGKGGGKADLAQAGGRNAKGMQQALNTLWRWADAHLSS